MAPATAPQADRSSEANSGTMASPCHTHAAFWKQNCLISWGELKSCWHLLFFFKESALQPLSRLRKEKPAAVPDVLLGWTLCAAREEHNDGQWPPLLLVLQQVRSSSSAAQSQAQFPPSSPSSSTAATEETRTQRTVARSISCFATDYFCNCQYNYPASSQADEPRFIFLI